MFLFAKNFQLFICFEAFFLTNQLSFIEKLVFQDETFKSLFLTRLIKSNSNLFEDEFVKKPKYLEKEIMDKKLKIELTLRLLHILLSKNNSNQFLNEINRNYLNNLFESNRLNELKTYKQLNATYCNTFSDICINECSKSEISNLKINWCKTYMHGKRHKRFASQSDLQSASKNDLKKFFSLKNNDDFLLQEILDEQAHKSLSKSFAFITSLEDSIKTPFKKKRKLKKSSCLNQCLDINECKSSNGESKNETSNQCDSNATCINTSGSFKCKCNKGFIGDGTQGNCFSGKFCAGRFCRQNGECFYQNNRNGYKCKCMLDCMNGGTCVLTRYSYQCKCPKNLTGLLCNETIQDSIDNLKYNKKLSDFNSPDNILLRNLINLSKPPNLDKSIKFEMFDIFEKYLERHQNKPKYNFKKQIIRPIDLIHYHYNHYD